MVGLPEVWEFLEAEIKIVYLCLFLGKESLVFIIFSKESLTPKC